VVVMVDSKLKIGSLFSGYGGLDIAVAESLSEAIRTGEIL